MVAPVELDETGAGDPGRHPPAPFNRDVPIAGAMHDQRGGFDRRDEVANVDVGVHAAQGARRRRARSRPQIAGPVRHELVVVDHRGCECPEIDVASPLLFDVRQPAVPCLIGRRPRVVVATSADGVRPVHDQRPGALGVQRCEHRAHRTALRHAEQHRSFAPDRVEDGAHIVGTGLDVRQGIGPDAVGESGAALVEADEPTRRRQTPQEVHHERVFPHGLDVRHPPGHVDEIELTLTDRVVSDAHTVGRLGVVHMGNDRCRDVDGWGIHRRVLQEDHLFEVAQLGRRLDAQLFAEDATRPLERPQRVSSTARTRRCRAPPRARDTPSCSATSGPSAWISIRLLPLHPRRPHRTSVGNLPSATGTRRGGSETRRQRP